MGLVDVLSALAGATGGGARGYLGQYRWQEDQELQENAMAAEAEHRRRQYEQADRAYGLQQAQFDYERKQNETEERRRAVEAFTKAAQEAGLGYMDPEKAYEMSRLANGDLGPAPSDRGALGGWVHGALSDQQAGVRADRDTMMAALPEAYKEARRRQAPVVVPGGDKFGGVVHKPDVFSPYTGMSASLNAGSRADANTLKATQQLLSAGRQAAQSMIAAMAPNLDAIFSTPQAQAQAIQAIKNAANNAVMSHYNVLVQAGQLPANMQLGEILTDAEIAQMLQAGKSPAPAAGAAVAPPAPQGPTSAAPAPAPADTARDPRAARAIDRLLQKKGVNRP